MKTENFVKMVEKVKEKNELDLNAWEDLSIGLMNLVSLEEHCYFSYVKTKDDKFLKMLEKVRESRKKLLGMIVKDDDGSEKWCMSKHYLASSMRLYEVGNRFLHEGNEDKAKEFYEEAAEMYGLFWVLNANKRDDIKSDSKASFNESGKENKKEDKTIFGSIKEMLKCCLE